MLEENITSLELSRKLSELGINKKTMFYWEYVNNQCYGVKYFPYCIVPTHGDFIKLYPAPTASELMKIIPSIIDTKTNRPFNNFRIRIEKFIICIEDIFQNAYSTRYVCDTFDPSNHILQLLYHSTWDVNLSNSLTKMLIFLIENNFIMSEDLNNDNN